MAPALVRNSLLASMIGVGLTMPLAPTASAAPRSELTLVGIAREVRVDIPLPAGAASPRAIVLPGGQALEVDLPVDKETVERALARAPTEFGTRIAEVSSGTRLRIVHRQRRLRFTEGRRANVYSLLTGAESEDTRLRQLANEIRQPLPQPRDLGAHLELWQEAETATSDGRLKHARRLWDKLAEEPSLRDLAELRIAELYIISGHVNQAVELLRQVSRQFPRSTGAALARLDVLRLEVITGDGSPTAEQVVTAALAGNRHRFESFAWLRATRVLTELGASDVALHNFPLLDQLPEHVRDEAKSARDALVSAAIGTPAATGRHLAAVVQYRAWSEYLDGHPDLDTIRRLVAESHLDIGLFEQAVPLFRLALGTSGSETGEAATIAALADAYLGANDLPHAIEVVRYQIQHYPHAPRLPDQILATAIAARSKENTAFARELLRELRADARSKALQRVILAREVDFAISWGTPSEQIQLLELLRGIGYDDAEQRGAQLAIALARDGRAAQAIPQLRAQIGRTTDPELRDEMTYLLARAENSLGNTVDARDLLESIASHSTHWGLVARARLRERTLVSLVEHVEQRNKDRRDN